MASFDFSIADIIDNSDEVISAVEEKIHLALALMGEEVEGVVTRDFRGEH